MGRDVFICYDSADIAIAVALCTTLEGHGMRCWIAPRDVPKGVDLAAAIAEAIQGARVMVLVFSAGANQSQFVARDLRVATAAGTTIIPLRVEDVELSPTIGLLLGTCHWVDALARPLADHLETAAAVTAHVLGLPSSPMSEPDASHPDDGVVTVGAVGTDLGTAPAAPATAGHLTFISAKSEDYEHANLVYEFLRDHGLRVFFSRESLPELGNSDYGDQIDEALEEAAHLIVVTSSREWVRSEWVKAEWRFFVNEKRGGYKPGNLLTVTAGQMRIGDLPATLRNYEVVPLTGEGLERLLAFVEDPPRTA